MSGFLDLALYDELENIHVRWKKFLLVHLNI